MFVCDFSLLTIAAFIIYAKWSVKIKPLPAVLPRSRLKPGVGPGVKPHPYRLQTAVEITPLQHAAGPGHRVILGDGAALQRCSNTALIDADACVAADVRPGAALWPVKAVSGPRRAAGIEPCARRWRV